MTSPFLRHTAKLALFCALQGVVAAALLKWAPYQQSGMPPEHGAIADGTNEAGASTSGYFTTPGLPVMDRLRAYLQQELYRACLEDPKAVEHLRNGNVRDTFVRNRLPEFTNRSNSYLASILDKEDRLRTAPGERIVFVGGSSVAFGLDSLILEQRYQRPVINMGLHALIDQRFLMRYALEHVQPGDVIVLSFEYPQMCTRFGSRIEQQERLLEFAPRLRPLMDDPFPGKVDAGSLAGAGEGFARSAEAGAPATSDFARQWTTLREGFAQWKHYSDKQALGDLASRLRTAYGASRAQRSGLPKEIEGFCLRNAQLEQMVYDTAVMVVREHPEVLGSAPYRRDSFNACGDVVDHRASPGESKVRQTPAGWLNKGYERASPVIRENLNDIRTFVEAFRQRGVTVVFACPPWPESSTTTGDFFPQFDQLLESELRVPVVLRAVDSRLPVQCFFDSPNHLNWNGTKRRMVTLVEGLDQIVPPVNASSMEELVALRDDAALQSHSDLFAPRSVAVASGSEGVVR